MLRRMLVEVVDDLEGLADSDGNGDFASAALDRRIELLRLFESAHPAEFAVLLELTFEAYYRDRLVAHVVERETGFRVAGPLAGVPSEEFDESWLDGVRSRPSMYAEVER